MPNALSFPRLVRLGHGALEQLPELLAALGVSRPLLVSDSAMASLGHVDRVLAVLNAAGLAAQVYTETEPEPGDASIYRGVEALRAAGADGLVALGGGSVIDTAKAMAVLFAGGGVIRDYAVPREVTLSRLPLVAVPTTAGTGS
ncbi:MAG: iron-containing alcohol dehydrogenase, partial [Proteobacteria bacterium]|nr:iron-containing alcohol dehydrogenase [Pseudomonadota bacterium]